MVRISGLTCGLAVLVATAAFAPEAFARALLAYPLKGQTPQQQEADRAACHTWAVQQSGYDPSGLPIAVRKRRPGAFTGLVIGTPTGPAETVVTDPAGGVIGGVVNKAQLAQIEVLYAQYLDAGALCLTARGYQVSN
jgi:hypothetical protein